ncbi:MAG: SpoIID/LytB domain-containing protein [candidate division WWE3 bacterium]|nr:SpoIID/LytB domain-containing protein [candidate division WWE3 bacterium]
MTKRLPAMVRLAHPKRNWVEFARFSKRAVQVRQLLTLAALLLLTIAIAFSVSPSRADELDDVSASLNKQQKQLSDLEKRQQQLSRDIAAASISLSQVSTQLTDAEAELTQIEKDLAAKEKELAQWEAERDSLARTLYKQSRVSSLEVVFSSKDLGESAKQLQYYNENLESLKSKLTLLSGEVGVFKENQATAKRIRDELADLRSQYASRLYSAQRSYYSVSQQMSEVTKYVKNLSERQKQLLAEKFGALNVSVGDVPSTQDPKMSINYDPGFSPRLASFSFGMPHRVGMSQYGAYGRSKANQLYPEILSAYYQNTSLTGTCDKSRRINVDGYGSILLEDEYLTGLGEMPASWGDSGGMEALKAQVVAARSYALNYSGSVCTTQACQVFLGKGAKDGTKWEDAVNATCGKVLTYGGSPIAAYYASTAGGYTRSSADVWGGTRAWVSKTVIDTPNGNSDLWFLDAYEGVKYGNSPYFYAAWYKSGSKVKNNLSQPWLEKDYMNDILNATLLYKKDNSLLPRLSALDWDSSAWDFSKVRSELAARGTTPVSQINSVLTIVDETIGRVNTVRFTSDGGRNIDVTGLEFLTVFNTRAPGYIHIKSLYKYPLFNIVLK